MSLLPLFSLLLCVLLSLIPVSHSAVCSTFTDCSTCTGSSGCGWCNSTSKCEALDASPKICPEVLLLNCNCSVHTTCTECALAPGCGWCSSLKECLTNNSTACQVVNVCECTTNRNCFDCLLESGCGWCKSTSTCHLPDDAQCSLSYNCSCSDIRNCESCSLYPNCEWCEDGDSTADFCFSSGDPICSTPAEDCSVPTPTTGDDEDDDGGFDLDSFVGGIFLGVGVVCLLVGLLWVWRSRQEKAAEKYSNIS
eukprot:TRINITY_DN1737_c0_g2_i1.p1 TRINITY_DN1737_c0_g2~~TRINITY_DN1737_c0_g2_i1.p1  ORF type:complete len:261 (+),score=32.35 TRINITY_DN1737_c0_g2_i1:28-783(+)